ncbi:MAG: T9SS type A sorting domain-containing protein [Flavobacteriales bacterium]|nr:T9SS type A sorting domain-containing protein [Flavobacteriales bacterium]
MKRLFSRSILFAAVALLTLPAAVSAQSPVDIALYRNGGMLDVTVRPSADFNGIFSAVVFTIKWDGSTGATLGQLTQQEAVADVMNIRRSGGVREQGSLKYQVYAGFGMTPMTATPWVAGKEYVIASIPYTGKADFELVNDAFTHEPTNNADYFVSLGGVDRTGIIYKGLASADEDNGVSVLPNPNNGQFTFTFNNLDAVDTTVELVNSLGQIVFTDQVTALKGTYRRDMNVSGMGAGAYFLKIRRGEDTSVTKVVVQ